MQPSAQACLSSAKTMHEAMKLFFTWSCAGTLMQAWEKRKTKCERKDVVQRIADNLQSISRPEAEALPDKDPEHI